MTRGKSKSPENKTPRSSDPTKTNLWTQVVITIGGISIAAIAAYQAIKTAQLNSQPNIPTTVPSPAAPTTVVNTSSPTPLNTEVPTPIPTDIPAPGTPLQRIDFDYQDSPTQHGWEMMASEAKEDELDIEHTSDEFVGNAISITSPVRYGMEYKVGQPADERGKIIEVVANLTKDAYIYVYIGLVRDDGSTSNGWLKLTVREGIPKPVDNDEWQLPMEKISDIGGDWSLYQVDLENAVVQTFGTDGWNFQQLEKFRIRGDLALDYINIYEMLP